MQHIKSALQSITPLALAPKPQSQPNYPTARPPLDKRKFTSLAVENTIDRVRLVLEKNGNDNLAELFETCYPNTLDTTIQFHGRDEEGNLDTFVITGDIPAMWLRDSTNQVVPYLPLAATDSSISALIHGVINRQVKCVLASAYSNAFKRSKHQWGEWEKDFVKPAVDPLVWEGKFELDSLAAFLKLSTLFYAATSDASFITPEWARAVELVIGTLKIQQKGSMEELDDPAYLFRREGIEPIDTLMLDGRGPPAKRCGLIKSPFRPSDDASTLPFIASIHFIHRVALKDLCQMLTTADIHLELAQQAQSLAMEISDAIYRYGVVEHNVFGKVFAYEVDGFGNALFMDDANIPSLLSLPYIDFLPPTDPIYLKTRAYILSEANPYYFTGTAGAGVGGPHCGLGYIWPMSIIVQALTTQSKAERTQCINTLIQSTAGTGFMHESFWKDDVHKFTRGWFAWANSLFAELVLRIVTELEDSDSAFIKRQELEAGKPEDKDGAEPGEEKAQEEISEASPPPLDLSDSH
ncbi:hypothetical protein SpCBS45565_g04477 [Spizellomyces sp. 'palustris']|nr:hypothetical protein SpCBS45565_g04477 [Spizellomyces sp. 'palustris']